MVTFVNLRYNNIHSLCHDCEIIDEKCINLQRLNEILRKEGNIIINNFSKSVRITNKGGHRLINYIRLLESSKAENLYIIYNPTEVSYQVKTYPEKLFNFSEVGNNSLFNILMNSGVSLSYLENGTIHPYKFASDTSLFEWLLLNDSPLCTKVFNQIHELKSKKQIKGKDLMFFSENLTSAEEVEKKYGLSKIDVIKAFLTYTI